MKRGFKIFLSVVFVLAVAFFVGRGFWRPIIKPVIETLEPIRPKMAIILDDWGHNLKLVKNVQAIGRPITLSILPHLPHSREIAEVAFSHGLGVMLHLPMQPKSSAQPMEPTTILTSTPDVEIIQYLNSAIESVPHVDGVNNHQGSEATSDERVMKTVLNHLKNKGLFFVDSRVISTSLGQRVAQEVGIAFTQRDVFIDNQGTLVAIQRQLRQAEKIALKHGRVVVIGHDKKTTIEAIRTIVPELEKNGVQLVLAKELLDSR